MLGAGQIEELRLSTTFVNAKRLLFYQYDCTATNLHFVKKNEIKTT